MIFIKKKKEKINTNLKREFELSAREEAILDCLKENEIFNSSDPSSSMEENDAI